MLVYDIRYKKVYKEQTKIGCILYHRLTWVKSQNLSLQPSLVREVEERFLVNPPWGHFFFQLRIYKLVSRVCIQCNVQYVVDDFGYPVDYLILLPPRGVIWVV